MIGVAEHSPHQVEIEVPPAGFQMKLRAMETWLREWEIRYRIGS